MYIVIGGDTCPKCDMAKKLLDAKGEEYEYLDMFADKNMERISEISHKSKMGVMKSIPQIVLEEDGFYTHVGGYNELVLAFKA